MAAKCKPHAVTFACNLIKLEMHLTDPKYEAKAWLKYLLLSDGRFHKGSSTVCAEGERPIRLDATIGVFPDHCLH